MTAEQKLERIDAYEQGARAFDDVPSLPPETLTFRPTVDSWTVHEHVVHFVESEIATFHRYRKAVAEPGGPVIGYDEEIWTASLNYHQTNLADSLTLLRLLRKLAAAHLRTLVDQDWKALTFVHSSRGPVNLETWLEDYIDHVRFHREFIDRIKRVLSAPARPS